MAVKTQNNDFFTFNSRLSVLINFGREHFLFHLEHFLLTIPRQQQEQQQE